MSGMWRNRTLRDGGLARFHWLIKLTHARQWGPEPRLVAPLNARPLTAADAGKSPTAGLTPTIARQPIRDQKADYAGCLLQALSSLGDRRHAWPAIWGGILSVCHGWAKHQTTKWLCSHGHAHVAPSPPLLKSENPYAGKFPWVSAADST